MVDEDDYYPSPSRDQVQTALGFILPILKELGISWWITGGFACYVYGVERPLTDIDIDLACGKDDPALHKLLDTLQSYITQPLIHLQSEQYDNYNFEVTYNGVILDFCPADDLKLHDKATDRYEAVYQTGYPIPIVKSFGGYGLPLLPIDRIIADKQKLQRPIDLDDIAALQALQRV